MRPSRTPEKPPIQAVLEHYGATFVPQRFGWASMPCPFHHDRTNSASVNTTEGQFKCFTCDVSGDVYDLIEDQEGIGFRDAVEFAARNFGEGDAQLRGVRSSSPFVPRRPGPGTSTSRYIPPGRRGRA